MAGQVRKHCTNWKSKYVESLSVVQNSKKKCAQ